MNFRHPIRYYMDQSIRRKFIFLTLAIAGLSLISAAALFSGYVVYSTRSNLINDIELIASLVGSKSAAALEFDDSDAALEDLRMLASRPNIIAATLYSTQGAPVAVYTGSGGASSTLPDRPGIAGHQFERDVLTVYRPIMRNGFRIGMIGIRSDLRELDRSLVEIALLFILITATISFAAYQLSLHTHHLITRPILRLTETIRDLSLRKDYSVRAEHMTNDEVGYLVDRFNEMLGVMQQHEHIVRTDAVMRAEIEARDRESTELRRIAEKLERSNRDLQEFASVASHDLQEPLRKVLAFADRLVSSLNGSLDTRSQDYLDRMIGATKRMQTLINDLLQYSRVSTKTQPFTAVNLNNLIDDVVSDLEVRIEHCGGTVERNPLPTVLADPLQMRQLFQNLIGNALKYHKPDVPPVVTIRGEIIASSGEIVQGDRNGAACARIHIADNGIGFDQKYREQIFAIFQRLHGRNEYEGTGIGLAICKKIVERHGGSISAESTPAIGSTFIFELPLPRESHAEQTPGRDESEPREPRIPEKELTLAKV